MTVVRLLLCGEEFNRHDLLLFCEIRVDRKYCRKYAYHRNESKSAPEPLWQKVGVSDREFMVIIRLNNPMLLPTMKSGSGGDKRRCRSKSYVAVFCSKPSRKYITTSMLLALAIIVAVVGGISLMGALSIGVVERTREIGVMRAIGARSRTIMGMFIMEGILQGLFSWMLAVPLSFILARLLANALGQVMFDANLDYQYNFSAVLVWLATILIISTLASLLPARNATQVSVRESLAYV